MAAVNGTPAPEATQPSAEPASVALDDAPAPGSRAELEAHVQALVQSYRSDPRGHYLDKHFVPSRQEILEVVQLFLALFYPGYHGRRDLTTENLRWHLGSTLLTLREKLERQLEVCLCYASERACCCPDVPALRGKARGLASHLLGKLPELRALLLSDAQAALDGDPAASSIDEILLAYPGMLAITVYRVAHELYLLKVPLMPRVMSEWAHGMTGADIHPGATIGPRFFIDHATGVVIGETATLGAGVRLYQGVTLGALSLPRDASGRVARTGKRHPTVEDNVTIYAGACVLGGETVIGKGSVVGGGVFLTRSVPPGTRVALDPPKLRMGPPRGEPEEDLRWWDFEI